MQKKICNIIEEIINLRYGNLFSVANYDKKNPLEGYLWVFKKETGDLTLVIHGNGTLDKPFEIRLIQIDESNTIDKRFKSLEALIGYINHSLLDDLMVYEI